MCLCLACNPIGTLFNFHYAHTHTPYTLCMSLHPQEAPAAHTLKATNIKHWLPWLLPVRECPLSHRHSPFLVCGCVKQFFGIFSIRYSRTALCYIGKAAHHICDLFHRPAYLMQLYCILLYGVSELYSQSYPWPCAPSY